MKIMENERQNETLELGLKRKVITELETQIGYLLVLEYILQDKSYLHVVMHNFFNDKDKISKTLNIHNKTFYREKDKALKYAHEIANNLLTQYMI